MLFFRTYDPAPQLVNYVRSYWILESDEPAQGDEMIIPDGCMELIFHYGDEYISNIADNETRQTGAVVVGQIKQAIVLQPSGRTGIVAVRFQPWGFYALTGIPAYEVTEQVADAADIWGKEIAGLQEQLQGAEHAQKIMLIEAFLLSLARKQKHNNRTPAAEAVVKQLLQYKGNIPIAHLAYHTNMSVRHFNRTLTEATGLSPKLLARIIRLQAFMNVHSPGSTLTDSLYKCGYFDQAHFIRDFREIAGTTPNHFFKAGHQMAELMLR